MTAGVWNPVAEQGVTFNPTLTCKDSSGALVDLSSFSAQMQVREGYDAATPVFNLSSAAGTIVLGGAAGTIKPLLTAAQMASLSIPDAPGIPPKKVYVHSIRLTLGSVVIRVLQGTLTVSREATHE